MSAAQNQSRGWRIGRVAGAPVILAPSWIVAAAVITLMFAPNVAQAAPGIGLGIYPVAFTFALLLFVSVLLHELAHGLVARARGVAVREFVITVWGGHTSFDAAIRTPGSSALIAVVGPLANALLAVAFYLGFGLLQTAGAPALVVMLVWAGAWANGFVALFNLLPGLPLDGGQILEAAIWGIGRDRWRGTVGAGWIGRVVAVGVVLWAVGTPLLAGRSPDLTTVIWAALIAGYLWTGAGSAIRTASRTRTLEALDTDALAVPALAVPISGSAAQAHDLIQAHPQAELVLVDARGTPVAVVEKAAVQSVDPADRPDVPLDAVAMPLPRACTVSDRLHGVDLAHAVGAIGRTAPHAVVIDSLGRVTGLLRVADVVEALR